MPDDTTRITELEIQLAHQQHLYEQLNEVVTVQGRELDVLKRRLHAAENQLKELREAPRGGDDLPHEKPPHY